MKRVFKSKFVLAQVLIMSVALAGCGAEDKPLTEREQAGLGGAALGAGAGAAIGAASGHSGAGAAIGAASGAVVGGLVGNDVESREDRIKQQEEMLKRQEELRVKQTKEIEDVKRQQYHDDYFNEHYK